MRPLRNPQIEWRNDRKVVALVIRRTGPLHGFCQRWFRVPASTTLELDDLGGRVWNLCDGKHTVEEIAAVLSAEFGAGAEPLLPRLTRFIQYLDRARLIGFAGN